MGVTVGRKFRIQEVSHGKTFDRNFWLINRIENSPDFEIVLGIKRQQNS